MSTTTSATIPRITSVEQCTLATCPLEYANVTYDPTLAGNVLYLALFGLFLFIQAAQLWRYRTWSYSFSMMSGLVLEIVGYLGRVQMHFNPFTSNPFLLYIICVTIAPVFFSAAIYITFSRIIIHYGREHARISPKTISLMFMTFDFIALVLQATGGAIADTASSYSTSRAGTHIMVAGLSVQVLTLLIFIAVATEFALNIRRARGSATKPESGGKVNGRSERSFKMFLLALSIATFFILVRSCFRVAELAKGFGSKLANNQISYMILEGAMIVLAAGTMTAFHPGRAFGTKWPNAGWSWKKSRADVESA